MQRITGLVALLSSCVVVIHPEQRFPKIKTSYQNNDPTLQTLVEDSSNSRKLASFVIHNGEMIGREYCYITSKRDTICYEPGADLVISSPHHPYLFVANYTANDLPNAIIDRDSALQIPLTNLSPRNQEKYIGEFREDINKICLDLGL